MNGLIGSVDSEHEPKDPIFWSDATFAMWECICEFTNVRPTSLRHLLQLYITNDITWAIIEQAMPYQRDVYVFAPDNHADAFYALLASPNGIGSVHLLMQHKAVLGRKIVTRIAVWNTKGKDGDYGPHMAFKIGDL